MGSRFTDSTASSDSSNGPHQQSGNMEFAERLHQFLINNNLKAVDIKSKEGRVYVYYVRNQQSQPVTMDTNRGIVRIIRRILLNPAYADPNKIIMRYRPTNTSQAAEGPARR